MDDYCEIRDGNKIIRTKEYVAVLFDGGKPSYHINFEEKSLVQILELIVGLNLQQFNLLKHLVETMAESSQSPHD